MLKKTLPAIVFVFLFLVLPSPVYAGEVLSCDGIECLPLYLLLGAPYYLAISLVLFVIIKLIFKRLKVYQAVLFSFLISHVLLLVYMQVITPLLEMSRENDKSKTIAKQINAPLYKPSFVPTGHRLSEVGAMDEVPPFLYFLYSETNGRPDFVFLQSKKPATLQFTPPQCDLYHISIFDFSSLSSNFFEGKCEKVVTPEGMSVYKSKDRFDRNISFVDLGSTLGIAYLYHFSDEELFRFIDSLEETSLEQINFQTNVRRME